MDIIVAKRALLGLLEKTHGVADKKSAMPALANVLLTATHGTTGRLTVGATDLYLSVTGSCACECGDELAAGSVAVPAKDLLERVKAMADGPVQILVNAEAKMTVKSVGNKRRFDLSGIPGSEFPQLPKPTDGAPVIEIPVATFALLIRETHFSVSTDETRPNVNSLLFEAQGSTVRAVSTDGHRLSKAEATIEGLDARATMLIPLKAVLELRRPADSAKADKEALTVKITHSGPNAFFDLAGMTFSVKLVDAQFPPYQQVIPAKSDHAVTVPRLALRDTLKAVSLAASDKTGGVKLTLATGVLRVTSESADSGQGFDELTVDFSGPEVVIGFNAKYILDVLDAIEPDEVVLGVSGELDPMTIKPSAETDATSFVGVVMPIRIA